MAKQGNANHPQIQIARLRPSLLLGHWTRRLMPGQYMIPNNAFDEATATIEWPNEDVMYANVNWLALQM